MERVKSMKRQQIVKELQETSKYRGKTQKYITDKLGGINNLRSELFQLTRNFDYYNQLPGELQNVILSESDTLKYYPRISKQYNNPTDLAYFNEFCDQLINCKELNNYMQKSMPQTLIAFYWNRISIYNRLYPNNIYYLSILELKRDIYWKSGLGIERRINDIAPAVPHEIDYKNKMAIYQRRRCEEIKPGYAKSKVLDELNQQELTINFNNYQSLLYWFMVLRLNCKQFNLPVPKNIYQHFMVTDETDEKDVYNGYTLNDLMVKLSKECSDMMDHLVDAITKY